MTETTAPHAPYEGGMRIAVYQITQTGERTQLRPETQVRPATRPTAIGFPPCRCPLCRILRGEQ